MDLLHIVNSSSFVPIFTGCRASNCNAAKIAEKSEDLL